VLITKEAFYDCASLGLTSDDEHDERDNGLPAFYVAGVQKRSITDLLGGEIGHSDNLSMADNETDDGDTKERENNPKPESGCSQASGEVVGGAARGLGGGRGAARGYKVGIGKAAVRRSEKREVSGDKFAQGEVVCSGAFQPASYRWRLESADRPEASRPQALPRHH
jgi:hypothetical protein